jgi:hypothetical protein
MGEIMTKIINAKTQHFYACSIASLSSASDHHRPLGGNVEIHALLAPTPCHRGPYRQFRI